MVCVPVVCVVLFVVEVVAAVDVVVVDEEV